MNGKKRVDENIIERIGELAQLELTGEEKEQAAEALAGLLGYLEILKNADLEETEPLYQVCPAENVFREDEVRQWEPVEELLQNAPELKDKLFAVPRSF